MQNGCRRASMLSSPVSRRQPSCHSRVGPALSKCPIYANSKISLSRELADKSDWTLQDVEERAEQYAQMSAKIFVV